MVLIVKQCDGCKTRTKKADIRSFEIKTGLEMDPSGNGYIGIWERKEYCRDCLVEKKKQWTDFQYEWRTL